MTVESDGAEGFRTWIETISRNNFPGAMSKVSRFKKSQRA